MPRPATGTYYRRAERGTKYRPVSDPPLHAQDWIYYRQEGTGKDGKRIRQAWCLFTTSEREARRRVAAFGGPLPMSDYDQFLRQLQLIGRRAGEEADRRVKERQAK